MARRSRNLNRSGQRDHFTISSQRLLAEIVKRDAIWRTLEKSIQPPTLLNQNDLRRYRPDRSVQPPQYTNKNATRIKQGRFPRTLKFAAPPRVAICVRRKQRKEVLFAKRLTRAGAGAKNRNFNFWSRISC